MKQQISIEQVLRRAKSFQKMGRQRDAQEALNEAIKVFPQNRRLLAAIQTLSSTTSHEPDVGSLSKADVNALAMLHKSSQFAELLKNAQNLARKHPNSSWLWNVIGVAAAELKENKISAAAFERSIELAPSNFEAHNNLGNIYKALQQPEKALKCYERSVQINSQYSLAEYNIGLVFKDQKNQYRAMEHFKRAVELNPNYADALNHIGIIHRERQEIAKAEECFIRVQEINPKHAKAKYNLGQIRLDNKEFDKAIELFEAAIEADPNYETAQAQLLNVKQRICDFSVSTDVIKFADNLGIRSNSIEPFSALAWSDRPDLQLSRALVRAADKFGSASIKPARAVNTPNKRIKVGYFSSDFFAHATMHLISGLFRCHNKSEFEVAIFNYGERLNPELEQFFSNHSIEVFEAGGMSDDQILALAKKFQLDIAVEMKGYTKGSRLELFQQRLAPIQISYLGFPGTTGCDFIDYLVADHTIIPEGARQFYTEKIIYLPDSYQPNDNMRQIAGVKTTKADYGLPEESFVFCCFNNSYKISSVEFAIWMRLLAQKESSVLWLIDDNPWAKANLRRMASEHNVAPDRLVFAPKEPHTKHLARHQHADLFLDTFNVCAHTTASDALWSGLPLIAKIGSQFAARVSASLLNSVGLPELVTSSEKDYEELAISLAESGSSLAGAKRKLKQQKDNCPLFDTEAYTRNYENALKQTYQLYLNDEEPTHIFASHKSS